MQRSNLQQSNFKSQCCMTVGCENFPALHANAVPKITESTGGGRCLGG